MTVSAPVDTAITYERTRAGLLVTMRGEIDAAVRLRASSVLARLVREAPSPVVVDTSGVTFMDSTGLAFLCGLERHAVEAGRSVALRAPSGAVTAVLELGDLAPRLAVERAAA
ncbi:anti-sigma factor antagonist [Xylanimonas oleitrophica]|uniref:Anti-sigma factor antagonist n=1 Tax=Xylanimonas oleitrophica TaxID=2607479 RepID=A0A2W5YEN7_9MICO|nr:STAS domain-containing protein [Xylanimonas oleitrophica]PZR52931.1 anti-sigma factor antagonist [Xylanimonas oleitrophica]